MTRKPTYQELEQRVKELEKETIKRMHAEKALQDSEEKSRTWLECSPACTKIVDRDFNLKFMSSAGVKALKIDDITQFYGKPYPFSFYPELFRRRMAKSLEKAKETGEVITQEASVLDIDGNELWFHSTIVPVNNEGRFDYNLIVSIDTTEHKQAEEALRASDEKYRDLYNNAPDMFVSVDAKTANILDCNQTLANTLGYTKEEIIGLPIFDVYHPDCMEDVKKTFRLFVQTGKVHDAELVLQRKDGSKIDVSLNVSAVYDEQGQVLYGRSTFRDITERKKAEEALLKQQYFLQKAQEIGQMGFWELDIKNNELVWTDENCRIFGLPIGTELTYETFLHYVHPDDREHVDTEWKAALNKKPYDIEHRLLVDGKVKWVREKAELEFNEKDECISATGFTQDITERRSTEEQLLQAQKMEAVGTLAGGVAHDYNNILTIIIGNASLALMEVGKDSPLQNKIEEIITAGERAASLTSQLLAFSRKQVIQPKILDLNELLTNIEKMLGRLIEEDIELLMIPETALWRVEVDPGQMEQVIMNMVVNAKDAMPMGGKLTIETANVDLDESYFREHGIEEQSGTYVVMAVSDTGTGMDEETQSHVFDPFFTTKDVGKGTGLGLSTVYGIVKQNKGFVWVYSEPEQGSTFKVYLPKVEGDAVLEERERTSVGEVDGSETVLIVEDDDSLRNLARKTLRNYGYKVLEAENGKDALRISKEHERPIDLMITDVVMPKMSGKETAERMQSLYPQMKVIYMSGYTDDAIARHRVLEPGLNFLEKPFSPKVLARKVRNVLDK